MFLNTHVPDTTKIHRLIHNSDVKSDYQVTLTDITFLKKTENDYYMFKAKTAGQDVVVKFVYENFEDTAIPQLERESQIYVDHLKPLWGVHVPKFYGFYSNSSDLDEWSCACIVLQYCGELAVSDLPQLNDYRGDKRFRNDVLDIIFRLHSPEIRVEHGALEASHILDLNGKPFIIGFGLAASHDCLAWRNVEHLTREALPAKEGEIMRPCGSRSVKCPELWAFFNSSHYCLPSLIMYGTRVFFCMEITSASALYETSLIARPKIRSAKEKWDDAVRIWQFIRSNWKKYHPDAAVEPPLGIINFEEYLKIHPDRCWL